MIAQVGWGDQNGMIKSVIHLDPLNCLFNMHAESCNFWGLVHFMLSELHVLQESQFI